MDLKEKIKNLPSSPGVYLMKDSAGSVIYVGKSKNLKSRVGYYFINSKSHSPKVLKMVKHLRDFEYILADTEFEAFMLECMLIKEIKPLYNKKMKSPMSYPYIFINLNEEYPLIKIAYEKCKSDGLLYWGPYTNKNTVERCIQGIKECCKIPLTGGCKKSSPCVNYYLGLCIGMCLGETSREKYLEIIERVVGLFNGTDKSIIEDMEKLMYTAVEKLNFEDAAKYRDYLSGIKYVISKAKVVEFTTENQNFLLIEKLSLDAVKLFLVKGHMVLFSEKYSLEELNIDELKRSISYNVLLYFKENEGMEISRDQVDESQIIYSYLNSSDTDSIHAIIPENWIENRDEKNIANIIDKLLKF